MCDSFQQQITFSLLRREVVWLEQTISDLEGQLRTWSTQLTVWSNICWSWLFLAEIPCLF